MNFTQDDDIFSACQLYDYVNQTQPFSIYTPETTKIELKVDSSDSEDDLEIIRKDNSKFCSHDGCNKNIWRFGMCILHSGRIIYTPPNIFVKHKTESPLRKTCHTCGESTCICECISCKEQKLSDSDDSSERLSPRITAQKMLPKKKYKYFSECDNPLINRRGIVFAKRPQYKDENGNCYDSKKFSHDITSVLNDTKTLQSLQSEDYITSDEKGNVRLCSRICWKGTPRQYICNKTIYAKGMCYYHWKKRNSTKSRMGLTYYPKRVKMDLLNKEICN